MAGRNGCVEPARVEEGRRMADNDRNRGYRDNDAYRRPGPQADASGDPLAELARLIGQQNQSAPSYRQNGARPPSQSDADRGWAMPDPHADQHRDRQDMSTSQWMPSYPDGTAADPGQFDAPYAASHGDPRYTYSRYGEPSYQDPHRNSDPHYQDQSYGDREYSASRYAEPRYGDPHYEDQTYADSRYADPRYADAPAPDYADPRYPEPNLRVPSSQYGAQSHAAGPRGFAQSGHDQGYGSYGYPDSGRSFADPYYATSRAPPVVASTHDPRPARKGASMVTVLSVLALAVVGTATAFGYRAMFGGAGAPVPPPVIKADTRPAKVVPATDASSKPIQDRIANTERIVPREEQPAQQAIPGQPRVIAPFLASQNPQAFPPGTANVAAPATAPNVQQPAAAAAEPKRIRTVPIKPEQHGTDAPAPRNTRSSSAAPATHAPPPNSDPIAAQLGSAPLALSPTGSVPQQRQAARQAHAAVAPANGGAGGGSPFPTPIPASTGSAPVSGAYAVQVTSQRSEADAQASYRSLQQQFPSVLGGRQPVIRRADLGEKGTYYRAQIPFQSQTEANEFCANLKAAGGQCVVQRN
jgi:hypothetical protein